MDTEEGRRQVLTEQRALSSWRVLEPILWSKEMVESRCVRDDCSSQDQSVELPFRRSSDRRSSSETRIDTVIDSIPYWRPGISSAKMRPRTNLEL